MPTSEKASQRKSTTSKSASKTKTTGTNKSNKAAKPKSSTATKTTGTTQTAAASRSAAEGRKSAPKPAPKRKARAKSTQFDISPEQRHALIAEAAYLRAETRGFEAGNPVDDWLMAEREIDARLAEHASSTAQ